MTHLDVARIQAALQTRTLGRSLQQLQVTDSTNDDARAALARGAPDGHTVVADCQRKGRGSRGHHWLSPPGTDLYLSAVVRPGIPLAALPPLTLAVGLAVAECAETHAPGARAWVKWPNDVLLGTTSEEEAGKVAGILVESVLNAATAGPRHRPAPPSVIVGIGLNVSRTTFPDGLDYPATSLVRTCPDTAPDRNLVLANLLTLTERWLDRFVQEGSSALVETINSRLAMRGQDVEVEGMQGKVVGVASDGRLELATEQGPRLISAGRLRRLRSETRRATTPE